MLAQSFLSATDLGLTEPQLSALQKTLILLETGKMFHVPNYRNQESEKHHESEFSGHFNMNAWHFSHTCGTVACIGGTAEMIGKVEFTGYTYNARLFDLFEPCGLMNWEKITPAQAATALRSYLTTGSANWEEAIQ